jgi:hypothetical protein
VVIANQENVNKARESKYFKAGNLLVMLRISKKEFFVRKVEHRGHGGGEI